MKGNLTIASLVALGILLIPLAIITLLALSYGMLYGVSYLLEATTVISIAPFKIEITHVLLGAIFLAVMFPSSQTKSAIEKLEQSVSYDLNNIGYKLDELSSALNEVEDIRRSVESIESNVDDIRVEKVSGNSEYNV